MFEQRAPRLALVPLFLGVAATLDIGQFGAARALGEEKDITVEVYFASEHVPEGLKAGAKVDLMRVDGKTVTRTGKVSYVTTVLSTDIEVASITRVEKPKTPEQAVKVVFQVTPDRAGFIERAKSRLVTVVETTLEGGKKETKRPVTLRLELTRPEND